MQNNNINILCTRPVENALLKAAALQGVKITTYAFIETSPVDDSTTKAAIQTVGLQDTTIVFTSMNAVEAVAELINSKQANWNIYCIGTTTNRLVKKYFGAERILGTANSAGELALSIINSKKINKLTFFCGDQRREELPEILRNNDIEVNEITVYKTTAIGHQINEKFDGILFFSPSAVKSFFTTNKIPVTTILFAIGKTTANEIQLFSTNKIIVSEVPGKENLVKLMMTFFGKN